MEEQSQLALSLEEKNVAKASLENISNEPEVSNKEVQSIFIWVFICNDMVEIKQEVQVEETSIILKDNFSKISHMIMPIYIEVMKDVLEEDLVEKVEFNGEHI